MAKATCSVVGCANPSRVVAKQLCTKHYYQDLRAGTVCSSEGCSEPQKARGLCAHHYRQREVRCSVCGKTATGDGRRSFCSLECRVVGLRDRRGTPDYPAAHRQVVRFRGKARAYQCADCGRQAEHWSYKYGDPEEILGTRPPYVGVPYSLNIAAYEPRCTSCHNQYDTLHGNRRRGRRNHNAKLSEADVLAIRAQYAAGGITLSRLAVDFDVSKKTVLNIVHRRVWAWLD